MKKNMRYIQNSILNEVLLVYNTRDVADRIAASLSSKEVELQVYETQDDGIVFRKKKDGIVTDDAIVKAFAKAIRKLVEKSEDTDHDIKVNIDDNYDFEYKDDYMTDAFIATVVTIRRTGRLISLEIDM